MEERTKQRLVGVLVFVGALFIVLPFLFHNSHPGASTGQKTADASAAVTVAMPAENSTTPALKSQTMAMNDANPTSPDQTAAAIASTDAGTPTPTPTPASPAPVAPEPVATSPAALPSATTTPSPQPAAAPTVPAAQDTANLPANNPTKFPSIAPVNVAAPAAIPAAKVAPAVPATATAPAPAPQAMPPAAPAADNAEVNAGENTDADTGQNNNTSLNKNAPVATATAANIQKPRLHPRAAVDTAAITEGWTVQLGAFSNKANANHLMATLRERHFHVYSRELSSSDHALTAVFVGPERSLDHARFAQQHLRTEFKLNGEIKRYES